MFVIYIVFTLVTFCCLCFMFYNFFNDIIEVLIHSLYRCQTHENVEMLVEILTR